jgi:hypothetical protein
MTRAHDKSSVSVNKTPFTTDRGYPSLHRSSSPMQRGDASGFVSARPLLKKSTVMLKESTSLYAASDKRSMLNQSNYMKAVDSVVALGGDEVAFNQSIKNLHMWISQKLIDKYYQENKVKRSLTKEKSDGPQQSLVPLQ